MFDQFVYGTSELTTSSLPAGTLYWRVRAHDANYNFGPWSGARTLTVTASTAPPPSAPSLQAPANGARANAGQSVTFTWSAVSGAASYELQMDDSTAFSVPLVLSLTVTGTQTSATLRTRAQMSWRVRAVNAAGAPGAWSSTMALEIQ